MKALPPPLRFIACVVTGWACLRGAVLAPFWTSQPVEAAPPAVARSRLGEPLAAPRIPATGAMTAASRVTPRRLGLSRPSAALNLASESHGARPPTLPLPLHFAATPPAEWRPVEPSALPQAFVWSAPRPVLASAGRRLSVYGWAFYRHGGSTALASGGLLGGSQLGVRAVFRLSNGVSVSARVSAPARRPAGAELAAGIEWTPRARLPVRLVAERRQALGRDGRSAFGLTAYGGVDDVRLGSFRIDAFAQAGIIGARHRDAFADLSVRVSIPTGAVRIGAGAWAAAQPGLSRVDVGPQASLRLPIAGRNVALLADWRLRVAGNARPGSGPSLTLATDF